MKKSLIISFIGVLVVSVLGFGGWRFMSRPKQVTPPPTAPVKKKITEPVNIIDVTERPYIVLSPDADGHNLTIKIELVKKPASLMEYEVEYQSGSLLQGFYGSLAVVKTPAKDTKLFGSKSAGGAVTYHEDIRGGSILSRFSGVSDSYALKSEWRMVNSKEAAGTYISKDAKFEISSDNLAKQSYIILFNSPGFPAGLKGKVISEIYSVTTPITAAGKATVKIRAKEEGRAAVMAYDGKNWKEYAAKNDTEDTKLFSAETDLAQLYLLVAN